MDDVTKSYLGLMERLVQIGIEDIESGEIAENPALQLDQSLHKLKEELTNQSRGIDTLQ